jgi:hypothetical protein
MPIDNCPPPRSDGDYVVKVFMERRGKVNAPVVSGELVALRRRGAKLSVPAPLDFAETVDLQIIAEQLSINVATEASVCRIHEREDGYWDVDCSFPAELSEELQTALARSGYLNQRQEARYCRRAPAIASWQLDSSKTRVEVRDYSAGGFCFVAPAVGKCAPQVLLELECEPHGEPVLGNVRWQVSANNETMVGCAFLSREAFCRLRVAAELHDAKNTESPLRCARASPRCKGRSLLAPFRRLSRSKRARRFAAVLVILPVTGGVHQLGPSTCPGPAISKELPPIQPEDCGPRSPHQDGPPTERSAEQAADTQGTISGEPDNLSASLAPPGFGGPRFGVGVLASGEPEATVLDGVQMLRQPPELPPSPSSLVLCNPAANGGYVQYVIDNEQRSLGPGQSGRFNGRSAWLIRFHRGGEYSDVRRKLTAGSYVFSVGQQGWGLVEGRRSLGAGPTDIADVATGTQNLGAPD